MSVHESTAAYLLGALPEHERGDFEAHLPSCKACQAEIEEMRMAADALPVGVEQFAAPADLKATIMATVRSEAELLAASGAGADRPVAAPQRRTGLLGRLAWRPTLAFAAALLAGLVVGLSAAGGPETRELTAAVAPQGASVTMEVRDGRSTLTARDLPAPPKGRVYQVWLKRRGVDAPEPTNALFATRGGRASVGLTGSMDDVEAVLVTHEPAGGSDAPTSQPIIAIPA